MNTPRTIGRRSLVLGGAGALALAGCSNIPSPGEGTQGGGGSGGGSGDKVELVYRLWDEQQEVGYKKVFAAFTEENPNITVRMEVLPWDQYWTKLTTELASGNGPDVFWETVENFPAVASKGVLAPLDDVISGAGLDLANYQPNVVASYSYDGQQYGMPKDMGIVGLLYNKDLFDKAGVTATDDAAWSVDGTGTFEQLATELTRDKVFGFGSWNHSQTQWLNWIPSNGGRVMDKPFGSFTFSEPENIAALQWARDLIFKLKVSPDGTVTNPPNGQATEMFYRGQLAMFPANNALLPFALPEVKFDIGVMPMPKGPVSRTVVINGLAECMYAKSKHPDEAKTLIAFLGSEKAQRIMGDAGYIIPALNDAGDGYKKFWQDKGIDVQPFLDEAAGDTVNMPISEEWSGISADIYQAVNQVYLNDKPIADIAAEMDKIAKEG